MRPHLQKFAQQIILGFVQIEGKWVKRGTLLILTLLFALLITFGIAYGTDYLSPTQSLGLMFSLILFTLICFVFLQHRLESVLTDIWHPEHQVYQQALTEFIQITQQELDFHKVLICIIQTLSKTISAQSVWIWLYHPENSELILSKVQGSKKGTGYERLPVDLTLTSLLLTSKTNSLPESALRQGLMILDIQTMVPIHVNAELIGLLGLEPLPLETDYRSDTLAFLKLLMSQAALVMKTMRLTLDSHEMVTNLQLAYRRTIDAQEEERRSLAVELHDDILGRLTTMTLTLRNCQTRLKDRLPDQIDQVLTWLEDAEIETKSLNQRLREITQGLHPSVLTDLGLVFALQAYLDILARQPWPPSAPHKITLTVQGFGYARLRDQRLERDIYSLTRQALDNAIKHAQAEQIFMHLHWGNEFLSITIRDTGRGLRDTPEILMGQNGRIGLLSMNERAKAWQGRLTFQSQPNKGTTVYAQIPLNQASQCPNELQVFTQYLTHVVNK